MSTYNFGDPTLVLLGAFRQALVEGRGAYYVIRDLITNWHRLRPHHLDLVKREIEDAIQDRVFMEEHGLSTFEVGSSDECRDLWMAILRLPIGTEEDYKEGDFKFTSPEMVLLGMFKYSLGRQTYMPSVAAAEIRNNWDVIPLRTQKVILRDIEDAIDEKRAGADCDVNTWKSVLDRGNRR